MSWSTECVVNSRNTKWALRNKQKKIDPDDYEDLLYEFMAFAENEMEKAKMEFSQTMEYDFCDFCYFTIWKRNKHD